MITLYSRTVEPKAYDGLIFNGRGHYRKFNGCASYKFVLLLKECEWRYNHRDEDLFKKAYMEMIPQIQAYFEAKAGNVNLIDNYFAKDIRIEDAGENDVIEGFDNCKKWLKNKSQQYQMETKIVDLKNEKNGTIKVSVTVTGNFAPGSYQFDYYFVLVNDKINSVKINYTGKKL